MFTPFRGCSVAAVHRGPERRRSCPRSRRHSLLAPGRPGKTAGSWAGQIPGFASATWRSFRRPRSRTATLTRVLHLDAARSEPCAEGHAHHEGSTLAHHYYHFRMTRASPAAATAWAFPVDLYIRTVIGLINDQQVIDRDAGPS